MKTKTIKLYTFKELSKEAQEKARQEWNNGNDYSFLAEFMIERLLELLKKNKIKLPDNSMPKLGYSLGYSQGDGVMFHGEFEWGKYTIHITHSGRYYHSNSKTIEIWETENDYRPEPVSSVIEKQFEAIYQKICKELEKDGYNMMEDEDSIEHFKEICEANDFYFTIDGTRE